ncbi:MAG: hypothetical protein AAF849_19605 [Bacteroidota bacterium]
MEEKKQINMLNSTTEPSSKLSWLKLLELQSWQAELLISGAIIAGLLQLPEIYINWIEGYLLESSELGFWFLTMTSLLILAGINALVFFLGLHFFLRSMWIALLGLNSVYPNGINVQSTQGAGPKYWKKTKEKYPNLSAYNEELDRFCSLIFSIAASAIIGIIAISLLILLFYLIFNLLTGVFPALENYIVPLAIGCYFLFMLFSGVMQYLMKKYPDNKRIERIIEVYGNFFGSLVGLYFFQKPMGYISGILTSNATSQRGFFIFMGFSFLLGIFSATQTADHPIFDNLAPEKYYKFNNSPQRFLSYNYENLKNEDTRIFTPIIPSDVIYGTVLKVFIPTIEREKSAMDLEEFGLLKKIKTKRAVRDLVKVENLKKYASFNQIAVNDVLYPDLNFQYYTHPNAQEKGVLVHIPTKDFEIGKNVLEIRKNYFSKKDVQKIVRIPFYFEQ